MSQGGHKVNVEISDALKAHLANKEATAKIGIRVIRKDGTIENYGETFHGNRIHTGWRGAYHRLLGWLGFSPG